MTTEVSKNPLQLSIKLRQQKAYLFIGFVLRILTYYYLVVTMQELFSCKILYFTPSSEHQLKQIYMIYKLVLLP